VQIALENKDIIWGMYCISSPIKRSQLSAETPSNRLMLPKKGKTIGYKPRPKFLIVAGHLSERTSEKTSENGSLNTKPNELKKTHTQKKKSKPTKRCEYELIQ